MNTRFLTVSVTYHFCAGFSGVVLKKVNKRNAKDGQLHGVAPSARSSMGKANRYGLYSTRHISYGPK